MTAARHAIVTPNTSADTAANRPGRLPRCQRATAGVAAGIVAIVLLGGVLCGFTGVIDAPVVISGQAATTGRA
jgi:hypothetical protein